MGELEPGAGEGVRELVRVLVEAARDFFILGIEAQREVGGEHGRPVFLRRIVRVRHVFRSILGNPLVGAGRALGEFPFAFEEVLEKPVAPLGGGLRPGHFESAGDGVTALAGAEAARPAEALGLDRGGLDIRTHVVGRAGSVGFSECVSAGDERHGFLVVHCHAGEGLADVTRGQQRVRIAVRAFGIHINEAHLHCGERVLQIAFAGVALVVEPGGFLAPVNVLVGLPDVRASAAEAEGLEAHAFERDVAGEDHQVGPGNPAAVFLFDRPEQAAGFVEAHVVRPTVERSEALLAASAAAASVLDAVGAGAVPRHADEERAVVAEVSRPPVLRVGHQLGEIGLHRREVEGFELLGVIEAAAHRVGLGGMLAEQLDFQAVGPPILVGGAAAGGGGAVAERALRGRV